MRGLLLVCALLALPACAKPLASIELKAQVQATRAVLTLGEVARLESADLAVMRALIDLPLGPAPAAGRTVNLPRVALANWIRARAGLAGDALQWSGADAAAVTTPVRLLRGEEIAATAEVALRAWLAAREVRGELQREALPRDVPAAAGELRLEARSLEHLALRPRMQVWVEVWSGDRFLRVVPVAFHVQAWRELPVAAVSLPAGAALDEVGRQEVDLTLQPDLPSILGVVGGLRTRHAVRAGEVLHAGNTETQPLVQRGAWASLRSGVGIVTSEARVEVLQDGRLGDSVRVRQPGAAAAVLARVLGPGQLEVSR